MDEKSTVWETMYRKLKQSDIDVYSPGQYQGECVKPYVVISNSGAGMDINVSSTREYYSVMCYVPLDNYSYLERFVLEVKEILKELFPLIRPDGVQSPYTIDDELKAYMISVEYMNVKKVNYL